MRLVFQSHGMMAWKLAFCCLVLVLLLEIQLVNSYTKGRHSKSLPYVRRGIKGFFRRNKCDNPAPPVNGQMRCQLSHRNRRVYECVATCIKGFEFPGKLAEMKRICNSFDGSWRPITEFPECEAICDPPCINGGKCAGNNHCICPPNFRGSSCNYDTSLCNPSDSLKFIGSWQCNHTQQETKCSLNCAQGTEFESQPADIYTCSVEGTWNPATAPKCIPVNVIHPTGSPYFPADKIKTIGVEEQKHSGVCATWGQFHYRTFDGSMYSFQGPCAYVLAKDSRDNTFSIHVKNDPSCVSSKTCHRLIVIYLGGDKYKLMHSNKKATVYHGTEEIPVPSTSGSLLLEKIAGYLVIKSSLGFSLKWDGKDTVLLSLASSLKNNTSGLCGRFDGSKENDFELVNGEAGGSVSAFANSWKMNDLGENCPDSVSQEHTCTYRTPEEKKVSEEALKTCQILWDTKYSVCHHIVNPIPYIEACRMDYCACSVSREECVCNSLAEYFRECVRLGGKIPGGWRSAKLCPLKCPSDMVYLDCGSSCPKMCTSVKYDCEDEHCVDGCHCPEGTVLLHNRCVKQDNCPCLHGGKYYEPGEKIEQECNSCECRAGEWECTKQKCEARCASTGDPHYKTFDGKNYDFLGTCSYYLVYHDKFTIVQENAPCQTAKIAGKKNTPFSNFGSCTKSVIITIGNSILTLKQNFQVSLNDHDIRIFPHTAPGLHIFMASSLFMKVELATGMSLLWDGKNRVYIDAPSSHFNKVKGLCGTFNHNQKDDFLTLEGDIEADVNTFAKKWTLGECKEQIPADEAKRPCDIYPQKSAEAQKFCSRLKSNYFRTGHDVVDPEPFYKKCIFDMCSCESKPEDCLCPAFADYGAECAKKGVLIRWRDNIKECSLKCTGGQTYQECADPCQHSCLTIASNVKCLKKCVEGCACPPGTTLNNDEMCIPVSECQCIFEGKEYLPNSKRLDGSDVCICENAVWNCRAASLKELVSVTNPDDLMQRDPEYCGKQLNMEYTNCVPVCPPTCQNKLVEQECATRICKPGCICKPGFVLDTDTKQCVKIAQCGCYHGNKRFVEGETIQLECNTCTCTSGIWKCGKKECPGICTTWGESHFSSFDGKMFDFQGDCEYILSKGKLDKSRSFTVIIKNVPCGTSGVTCSKSLTVDVGGEEKVTLTQNKPVPKTGYTSNFIVREVGLFVSVYTKHGVTVQWDKGTRVYVRVDTKWKGRLKGLCGNFDDDQSNDFRTPSGGPPEARPVVFGNSWKVHESCPYPRDIKDTCLLHPQRRTWALSKCGVLKSDIFKPCHSEVSLDPYYERCVFDACACDSGGDCECLCTALAAYAQECNFHGVPIKWRSQELCPIQCEDCAEYQACLSTCPKLTCETQYLYATLNEDCAFEPCVEGCETKPCPFGQIYNNDREFKCIPIVDCQVPCKKINGKVYMEGERVTDPETVDPCQSCFCQKGELICEGEPCATSTTRAYQRDKYPCKKTDWTPWMNSPYQVGGDYELLEDLRLFQVYSEYCGTDNITKIECRVVGSKKSIKAARQYATCDLPKGLVCNDREQTSGMCQDYEIRVYCQCKTEPVISPSTTPLIITEVVTVVELPSECTAPGWTFWMNSNKPDEIGDDESIGELRKKYVFCPESEIEKVECRVASTKSSYEFSKDQNVQCSKEGLICKNSGRGDFSTCADYEVRFYCKCADTACDFPRGMEKDYISGQEVSVSSFRSPSTLGNKARLNGNSAWSAEYLSTDQWIQVDLQELQDVTGVITQGSPLQPEWVTAYKVSYSRDNVAFSVVKSPDGSETVFTGNNDQNTPVTNKFDEPLKVRFVRIIPFQWKGWISLRLEILGCNREISVGTTTVPPCVPGWTRYFNIDSPKSGDGDIELFKDIRTKYDLCKDSFIQKIECRSFVDGQMVDHTETGDVGIKCSINKGLVCLNWLQKKGKLCHDYSIRVYCGCGPIHTETESITPVVTTPSVTIPTCTEGWTNFYNTDVPFTGDGDFESVKELIKKYQFCSVDQVIDIKCKASVKSPLKGAGEQLVDWKETGDKAVECSTSKGLVCYNNQQGKGGKCHDYSIQLYCQCVPEPRHRVLCNWTDWWNKDDPDGEGDIESIEMYQNEYGVCKKPELKAIECRLSKTKHDYREVSQKVTCDIDTGLSCYNKHQIGKCHDYEVRFFCAGDECPGIIPPIKPTPCVSSWTPFFNTDSPTSGEGDIELLVNIQKRGSVCFDKYIAGIECKTRIGKTVVDYTESGDFGVKCSLAVGLVCENSLQKKGRRCHDYSIRFFCSCVKPKTTTPQPVITTSPCPLTQVYDDCGYRCNQTCQSFFNLLVKEQKCVLGTPSDLCIPGCRPTKTCSAPYVWRDYSTCVRKEECTCVLPDGTILSPGRVIDYNCQKCQCQDNHLICIPIPHCGETPTKEVFTQPTPTHAEQNRCWTNWINIDSPLSGSGDMEDLTEIRLKYSLCSNPLAIECRVVSSKESSVDAGQNAECDLKTGLHCWNNVNGDEGCYDYEIRLLCPCPGSTTSTSFLSTTTPQPTCTSGWTKWFSSHVVDGKGDYETLQNIQSKGFKLPCESNMITAIECRPIGIPSGVPKQNIVCDIKLGFICENRQGKGGQTCYDYEVRFLCECEGTTVTAEVTTESSVTSPLVTTVVIVPTTPSVLPPCTNYKHLISGPTPLPDENLKASSTLNSNSEPQNSRLTLQKGPNSDGAWIPAYFDKDQYLEVDLGKTQPVYGIIVKGQDKGQSWVTAFRVMYSSNDQSFSFVTESSNYKVAKVFTGNYDSFSEVKHIFVNPFEARYIRVQPLEWVRQIALRLELLGCEGIPKPSTVAPTPSPVCQDKMGLENGRITPDQVRVTSSKGPNFGPSAIALNSLATKGSAGGWVAKEEDSNQFVEINLLAPKNLTGLITQGRNGISQWVTSYYIAYKSTKDAPYNYLLENKKPKIFAANFDSDTQVTNYFPKMIRAQFLHIHPFRWHNWIAMRLELLGCFEATTEVISELPVTSTTPFIISKCKEPMGLENGQIQTGDILVSSSLSPQSGSNRIRLNTESGADGTGGWVAKVNDQKQFVEISFPSIRELSGIITQGREDADNWVTNFAVFYTIDHKKWTSARNIVGNEVFKGNTDRNSLVYNLFNTSVSAVAVRIVPLEFYGGISMRLELLGCFEPYETCIRYGPWISLSTPKPGNVGDQEPIKKIVGVSGGCLNPVRIQCREYVTHKDYSTMQQKVTCDLSRGLLCRNQDQSQNYCFNYEVRIGCWICGPNVTTTTLPPVPLCPEIPSILSTGCPPDCPPGKVCDGISCVDLIDCPCMQENKRFKPGDILETRDCQTCVCHMKGHSRCEQKKCPKCPEGEKQKLTSACKCTCEGCPKGTVLCPTDGQCINSNLWCDGAIDCPDDEVNCEKTEVPVITTTLPPTVPPTAKPCVTDVPYGVAVCTVQNEYISTFDKLDYKYAVCEHTLMREKAHHWYSVSVFKKCTDSKPQYCDKVVKVIIEGLEFSLGPTINDFKIDNTVFHPDNFWIISEKLKDIRIQRVGQELILKSIRYGFDVIIDSQQNIKIKASYCLVYKVSGLCGNYNNNKRDDKETPEEEQVLSTEHFGDSWSLSTTQKCLPPVCPAETMKHALEICEHVRKPPFEVCASDMVIDTYISLCLSTVCDCLQRPDNDPEECKCSAIENFVQSCRSATKAPIGEWRIAHGCAPKCPPGLVWQDCGSPCEKNCDNFQREDLVCPAVCVSGCFCPPGLLRHGRFCVKPEMCHDCICKGYGDPNYYTFDGHYYPFQGNCTYVLAQHRTNKGYRDFQVFGTNVECQEEPNTACLSAITVRFKGNTVTVEKGKQVTFNGYFIKESDYPFVAEGFNITAVRGRSAVVQVPSINLAVRYFELNFGFYIELPSKYYWNSTEGLCGICNFDASDDMYHRNGYVTDNVEDFAYSWLTNGTREMCTISKIKIPTPPPEICNFTSTACEFVVDPIPFREACKNDVSYSMKPGRSVCRAKLEYAQQCCKRGISLGKWLELNNCGFDCPSNMIFECRSPCVKTCDNYKTLSSQYCTLEPHFSCFCSQDKVLKQGECVDSVVCETCDAEGHVVGDEWSKGPCEKCSCTEDLKVKCTETLCPPTPVCKINETLKIIPPKNGSCCQTYICEMEVKKCKEINPPDCKLGEVAKIDTSKECPVYVCECDEKMCPPLEWPVKLDVGQGTEVHPSGCCKQVVVKCYLNKCPPVPDCPKGFELQVNKGVCCNISTCEKKDVCVYKHTYETVDGMERKLKPEEQYSREYEPDSTWPDGLCRNCTCTGSNGKFTFNCRVEICPKISDFIDKDDYVRVEENVPGACCPKFRRLRCKHGNHTYIAGDSWPSPDGDKCKKYKCVTAPNGEVQKVEQITTCKKDCPPFAEYVEPAPDSPDCCGHCKIVACEENGQVYQVGVKWNSTEKPCYEAECIEKNGTIQTLFVKRECLPIPDTCPKEDIVFDDFGCCKKCRFIPGTCVPMRVPKVETVNFFKMYERNRGTCTNKKPISDLVECRGHCKSSTVYSPKQDTFVSSCDCCTASGSVKREIILDCEDGSELKKTFFQPKDCVCTECGQYGKEILLPTPLK